jgi:predicted nucleic acid-binding protein
LPFTRDASPYYAAVVGKARRSGRSLSVADAQIAAIAALHGFIVATRDAGAFVVAGVGVVNPWTDETS